MRLTSIEFTEFKGCDHEWILESFDLAQVNLLVGKNATGKSRTINIISGLARLLSGDLKQVFESGTFDAHFANGIAPLHYSLEYTSSRIERECLQQGDNVLLQRFPGSYG